MNFLSSCEEIAGNVKDAVSPLIGTKKGDEVIGMGADKTPTKRIDKVAEDCILAYLQEHELGSLLISEEAGRVMLSGNGGTIYLDPIDGTYNAVKNIPFFAVSIACADDEGLRYGFVENLATGEKFTAVRNEGAYLNGKSIQVSNTPELHESAMSIYGKEFSHEKVMHLVRKIRRYRQFGASAIELAYVASGKIDGFVDVRNTLRITDAAAGILICQEAGGSISDVNGMVLNMPEDVSKGSCLIATNGIIHNKVIEYLREVP